MADAGAREPDEFSVGQWPDWSFGKDPSSGYSGRTRGSVAVAAVMASLALIARAVGIAHHTGSGPLTSLAIGLLACYGIGCVLAPWYGPTALRRGRVAIVAVVFLLGAAPAVFLASPSYLTDLTPAAEGGPVFEGARHGGQQQPRPADDLVAPDRVSCWLMTLTSDLSFLRASGVRQPRS
ncbi:hypothetical protein A8713_30760 [Streptomyces sp. SAT1]|uniref:hypothetical protein n=1 Tax=Streptomyces sp. SAT1 TaxID=1849967 RepID=UPI0007DD16A1|nr:hypothetical protein [Streptomyces sp. SAT1]ANH95013.1 hypothetical protein A8713_30760 [Streptomyces sp. SAT1]